MIVVDANVLIYLWLKQSYAETAAALLSSDPHWIAPLLWRMDTEYKGLRREIPWVRRLPSEYFREHVWVSTQPLELSPRREQLIEVLGWIDGSEQLVFSSDYPHWDSDEIEYVRARLPQEWQHNVFRGNAMRLYDWSEADLPEELASRVGE